MPKCGMCDGVANRAVETSFAPVPPRSCGIRGIKDPFDLSLLTGTSISGLGILPAKSLGRVSQ